MRNVERIIENLIRSQHKPGQYDIEKTSMMIKVLFIRFIDWLAKEVTLKIVWHDDTGYTKEWHYLPGEWGEKGSIGKCWSLDELFVFWYDEISEL